MNTFPYKVNPGEKATIQIEGDHRSTTLRVNGKVVEEMNIQKCYFNAGKDSMSYIRTLVFPLEKAGNFNSRIENLKVDNLNKKLPLWHSKEGVLFILINS